MKSGAALADRGVQVDYLFEEDLVLPAAVAPLRRLLLPWLIATRVWRIARGPCRPDVVEIHEPWAAPYAALRRLALLRRLPPCVVMSHGLEERFWLARRERLRRVGQRLPLKSRIAVPLTLISQARVALRSASQVLVLSTEDADFLATRRRIPPERIKRINGGVDDEILSAERSSPPAPRLLFVGSWIDRKGATELAGAWCRLRRSYPELTLTLAGTQPRDADRVLSDFRPDCRDGITVVPSIDDRELLALLTGHDVFVLPTWFEGMPLSMIEAAAAGLACVVTSVCGNVDFFRRPDPQADGAILILPHSVDALVEAVSALADDPDLRARLGANARKRAAGFTWGHTADQALAAYRAALGDNSIGDGENGTSVSSRGAAI